MELLDNNSIATAGQIIGIVSNLAIIVGVAVAILTLRQSERRDRRREIREVAERISRQVLDEVLKTDGGRPSN